MSIYVSFYATVCYVMLFYSFFPFLSKIDTNTDMDEDINTDEDEDVNVFFLVYTCLEQVCISQHQLLQY